MSQWVLYAASAAATVAIAGVGAFVAVEPVRRLLSINIAYSGVFLAFVALARRTTSGEADPVPHALVLTGIVVSVSSTALALSLTRRLVRATERSVRDSSSSPDEREA